MNKLSSEIKPNVIVLCGGGTSSEREISLLSGENIYNYCKQTFPTKKVILEKDELPYDIAKCKDAIIFPITHGEFGEDGSLQKLMENAGLNFVGSNSTSSMICMDKTLANEKVKNFGIPVIDGLTFTKSDIISVDEIISSFGEKLFIKPNAKGSSVDTHPISSKSELIAVINKLDDKTDYILEKQISGIDLTVGLLDGKALEIVEIHPKDGFFDYENKYTPGKTEEICPARIPNEISNFVKHYSELAFKACECRDWARADFLLSNTGEIYFLELNTLPGMTNESLFPKSSTASGINLQDLVARLVNMAYKRSLQKQIRLNVV